MEEEISNKTLAILITICIVILILGFWSVHSYMETLEFVCEEEIKESCITPYMIKNNITIEDKKILMCKTRVTLVN